MRMLACLVVCVQRVQLIRTDSASSIRTICENQLRCGQQSSYREVGFVTDDAEPIQLLPTKVIHTSSGTETSIRIAANDVCGTNDSDASLGCRVLRGETILFSVLEGVVIEAARPRDMTKANIINMTPNSTATSDELLVD